MRRRLVRINREHRVFVDALTRRFEQLHETLWLGLLRPDELQRITDQFYGADAYLQDRDYNLGGMNYIEVGLVEQWFAPQGTVLLLGSGAGREAISLARMGFRVTAIDCNPTLVEKMSGYASEEALQIDTHERVPGDLRGFNGPYDAVMIGLGAYTHIVGQEARVSLLRELRTRVTPAGTLLFSFYHARPAGLGVMLRVARSIARITGSPRKPEPHERLRDTYDRAFEPHEIAEEMRLAGWRLVETADRGLRFAVGKL